jgi:predicted sugar kinase
MQRRIAAAMRGIGISSSATVITVIGTDSERRRSLRLQVQHRIPAHNGFGSEEDTLLNVARLIPRR